MDRHDMHRSLRILMIISAFMLMMLLCGCRTRITNNTDVTQVMADDGMMSQSYQERRDELGIPVAESPLFDNSDSDEEDEDEDEFENYDEYDTEDADNSEEYEDEDADDEDEDTDSDRSPTTPQRRTQPTVIRRPTTTPHTTPTITYVKVTLNLNAKDATCTRSFLSVRKDSTYGMLPTPVRNGYTFEGWYTAKEKGSKVTSSTKVSNGKEHTLYAHWKKIKVKTYKIAFDGNGEDDEVTLSGEEITVKEGGTYGKLPSAKRKKHSFKGWFTEAEGGSQITKDTKFTANKDQTLYAHWEFEPYKWWNDEFKKSANEIDEESQLACWIDGDKVEDSKKSFLKDCRCSISDNEADAVYIVKFIKDYSEDNAAEEAGKLIEKYSETAPGASVLIISDSALKTGKNQKLVYKMKTFDLLYTSSLDLYEAESDLLDGEEIPYPSVYSPE